ncbi:MAG: hypothetical protein ABEJ89_07190 [Haloarculaceae archaeon]
MKYADTVVRAVRLTVRNPFAIVLVSVATSVSLLPLFTGALVAGPLGAVVGLWTTSLLLGFVAVGGARLVSVVYERELSLGTSYFWDGIRAGTKMAPVVGVGTFLVVVLALVLLLNPFRGLLRLSVALLGVYALLAWYVLATFALAVWAASDRTAGIRSSFAGGGALVLEHPVAGVWVLVQTIGWTLLSIPLIIAPVLLLPGFAQLVNVSIARRAAETDD